MRRLAAVLIHDRAREGNNVPGLRAIERDRLDPPGERLFSQRQHLFWRARDLEQRGGRLVDAGVRRLRREHHRDQQRERTDVVEFAFRLGIGGRQSLEYDFGQRGQRLTRSLSLHMRSIKTS